MNISSHLFVDNSRGGIFGMTRLVLFFAVIASTFMAVQLNAQTGPASLNGKVACFLSDGFPTVDSPRINSATLKHALNGLNVEYFHSVRQLNEKLNVSDFRLLVLPYGSAFPVGAWDAIHGFLSNGGSLVYLGGYPFHQPVLGDHGSWIMGTPQPTYAHELLIGPADSIVLDSSPFYSKGSRMISLPGVGFGHSDFVLPSEVFELTVRFATKINFPDEGGSDGPRDAVLRPLLQVVNGNNLPVACPLLEIDRLQGASAGGRWILEPSDLKLDAAAIRKCVDLALEGASLLEALPVHACVDKGEIPIVRINQMKPGPGDNLKASSTVHVVVKSPKGSIVFEGATGLVGTNGFSTGEVAVRSMKALAPGLYTVDVANTEDNRKPDSVTTGFWVMDRKLLQSAPPLSVSKDWLLRGGKVFPIVGTTYMASDVDREFLLEPNPYLWNKDFARMQRLGVNFIRTGIWTGWKRLMLSRGAVDEGFLRALDAFVLTAAKHDIVVCFNLFAFSPPMDGGSNPYVDPRALGWQDAFVTLIASRYRNVGWINYDLINEPSYSPPDRLWNNLPVGDKYEQEAWQKWVLRTHGNDAEKTLDDWRDGKDNVSSVPNAADLTYEQVRGNRNPRKGLDFDRFTQSVVAGWAAEMRQTIRDAGGDELVTLGQDEGGTMTRPKQQFFYPSLDYTSIHTWWFNDNLLWDVASTKVPEEPSIVSETGLMRLEDIDGNAWRSPVAARNLLERKFAYAFQGEGAGVLEWAWNINPYQPIDNEAVIGFERPDGTFKIEIEVLEEFASFFKKAQPYLGDYRANPVILVSPDSKMFSGQQNSMLGVQRIVRVLAEKFGIVPEILSEYKLTPDRLKDARLIIVPDAEMLYDSASVELYHASKNGTKILFTGAVEGNEYGKLSKDFLLLGLNHVSAPVSHYEPTNWEMKNGRDVFVTFGDLEHQYLRKSDAPQLDSLKGNILQEALPLEYASQRAPLIALLDSVLKYAGVRVHRYSTPVASRVLDTGNYSLVVLVNESSANSDRDIFAGTHEYSVSVEAGRTRLALIDRSSGKIIAATEGNPITMLK